MVTVPDLAYLMQEFTGMDQPQDHAVVPVAQPVVDLCDPKNSDICNQWRQQFALRDRLSRDIHTAAAVTFLDRLDGDSLPKRGTVYLNCSDGNPSDCTTRSLQSSLTGETTHKLETIAADIARIAESGSRTTSLREWLVDGLTLIHVLSGNKQTNDAPMLNESRWYWETASRPYEKLLIEQLTNNANPVIRQADLMQTALAVCGKDTKLAVLTVANFTKNMAGIERRQIRAEDIDPSLRSSYDQRIIDNIFGRLEGLTDNPAEKYNKEGAIYHFWGAALAASQLGTTAYLGVLFNNLLLEDGGSDPIKAAAGLMGARAGMAVWNRNTADAEQLFLPGP